MAKIPFSKLGLKVNNEVTMVTHGDQEIEVRQYLPMTEKLDVISNIVNQSVDNNGFYNPVKVKIFMAIEVVSAYTNLSFTVKQKEDPLKLYDLLISTGLFNKVIQVISSEDWKEIQDSTWSTISNIYQYRNSVLGILESISTDYSNLSLEASDIQQRLTEGNGIEFLQEVISKLG